MIDNFDNIIPLLKFESEDDFYFVQIIQRKKDNPGGIRGSNNSSRLIKGYYIKSVEHLLEMKDEIIKIADLFNARVGINLNKRSFYKTSFNTLKKMSEQLHNKDFRNTHRAWNTACGVLNDSTDRIWIIDIDPKDDVDLMKQSVGVKNLIPKDKYITTLLTKSGIHYIVKAFNCRELLTIYPEIELHKNNPTNLYIP
jgi:hypothetical protein